MRSPWQIMTRGDWLVVLSLLAAALLGLVLVATAPNGSHVVVTSAGQVCFTAPMNQAHSVDLEGPLGKTHLIIDDQGARIGSSPCPRKICMAMGSANRAGDLLACVPNRILVRIDSPVGEEAPYDLLSR